MTQHDNRPQDPHNPDPPEKPNGYAEEIGLPDEEDEAALDRAWARFREERAQREVMRQALTEADRTLAQEHGMPPPPPRPSDPDAK